VFLVRFTKKLQQKLMLYSKMLNYNPFQDAWSWIRGDKKRKTYKTARLLFYGLLLSALYLGIMIVRSLWNPYDLQELQIKVESKINFQNISLNKVAFKERIFQKCVP